MLRTSGVLPFYRRLAGLRYLHPAIQAFSFAGRKHLHTSKAALPLRNKVEHRTLHTTMQQPLDWYAGPLVWIDCEMTGLDPRKDRILEIAVLITNGNLDLVDDGIEFVIKTEKQDLDAMDEWCTNQHALSGLTGACLKSPYTKEYVTREVLAYIRKWIPGHRTGILAGNSVHADRSFLVEEMPEVVDWLHYRIVDVSSIKELARRWYPSRRPPKDTGTHRALDDIRGSIRELKWYRENIFIKPGSLPGSPTSQL